ncbi:MAG: PqqD family peptide modification chaperone [Alphaproteobacteria bacterium GM202ARS2]|nr:PqqD family peptide modification chaperone [Alphaproteobacteria bacterium GM202ARS2]
MGVAVNESNVSLTLTRTPDLRIQVDADLPKGVSGVERLTAPPENVPDIAAILNLEEELFALNLSALAVLEELESPLSLEALVERFHSHVAQDEGRRIAADIEALSYDLQEMGLVQLAR